MSAGEQNGQVDGGPLLALLEGRIQCVEYAGTQTVIDTPRQGRIYLPGSFNPLHIGHLQLLQAAVQYYKGAMEAAFEITVVNPDKGTLELSDIQGRVQQFVHKGLPVVITRCALYTLKAALLPGSRFVVGYDTAVRLVMTKYYGGTEAGMMEAFDRLRAAGCKFLVAGRLNSATGNFLTLEDVQVPPSLCDLFEGLGEQQFRVDLSSTQLRQQAAAAARQL